MIKSIEGNLDSEVASFNEKYFPDYDKAMQMDNDTNYRRLVLKIVGSISMSFAIIICHYR